MKAIDLCPPPHLTATEFPEDTDVVIARVGFAEVGEAKERKGVVYFEGMDRGLVLNRTNTERIVEMHGNETDDWIGERITLYASETDFGGKVVPCIRVRPLDYKPPRAGRRSRK